MLEMLAGFVMLTVLEVVLGIDNMLVIAILSGRLPKESRLKAQRIGLSLAMLTRVLLLCGISWLVGLKAPILDVGGASMSWRDIILLAGGLFLLWKSVHEIHHAVERPGDAEEGGETTPPASMGFANCVAQIVALDIVFSLDSVITAVGVARHLPVMAAAVIAGALSMMAFTEPLSDFIHRNPSIKVLALAFLTLIGTTLVLESFHVEIPKGYLYCSMGFAFAMELLHMRRSRNVSKRRKEAVD